MGLETGSQGPYMLETAPKYVGFQSVEVTKVDDTKPWKPALEVKVKKADGTDEVIDANTPFFTFVDTDGKKLVVTAAAAGHVDSLHIKGEDPGSRFSQRSLKDLMQDIEAKLPAGIATAPGVSAFDIEMGKNMGNEGLATLAELEAEGIISSQDSAAAEAVRQEVGNLNKSGDEASRNAFVERFRAENPECKIQFKVVRGAIIVPTVATPKRPTTKLFLVFGPVEGVEGKAMYTTAPGRNMPRHPNPAQFRPEEGGSDGQAYQESAKAWFDTAMLIG